MQDNSDFQKYQQSKAKYKKYKDFCNKYVENWYDNLVIPDIELQIKCQQNFWFFCHFILKEINPSIDCYEPWVFVACSDVQKLHSENGKHVPEGFDFKNALIVNATVRLGKTFFYTILHACWAFGISQHKITKRNEKFFIEPSKLPYDVMIQTASHATMKSMSAAVSQILNSKIFKKLMPFCNIGNNDNQERKTLKVTNSSIQFATTGSSLTGRGFNLVIGDDIINPYILHTKLHDAALEKTEVVFGRKKHEPRTKYVYVEQRLDYKDITNWALKRFTTDGVEMYYRTIIPYYAENDLYYEIDLKHLPPLPKINGESMHFKDILNTFGYLEGNNIVFRKSEFTSPRFSRQDHLMIQNGTHYRTHYQNDEITEPSGGIFTAECLRIAKNHSLHKLSLKEIMNSMQTIVIGIDTAVKDNEKTSDRTAFGVVGLDEMTLKEKCQAKGQELEADLDYSIKMSRFTIFEATAGFWDPRDIVDEMIRLYLIYGDKLERFQIENNNGGEVLVQSHFIRYFEQEMIRRRLPIKHNLQNLMKGKHTIQSKKTRLTNLSSLYLNGQIRHVIATNEIGKSKKQISSIEDVINEKNDFKLETLEHNMMYDKQNRLEELEKDEIDFNPSSSKKSPDLADSVEFAVNFLLRKDVTNQEKKDEFSNLITKRMMEASF